jgi:hypothetical protein
MNFFVLENMCGAIAVFHILHPVHADKIPQYACGVDLNGCLNLPESMAFAFLRARYARSQVCVHSPPPLGTAGIGYGMYTLLISCL